MTERSEREFRAQYLGEFQTLTCETFRLMPGGERRYSCSGEPRRRTIDGREVMVCEACERLWRAHFEAEARERKRLSHSRNRFHVLL